MQGVYKIEANNIMNTPHPNHRHLLFVLFVLLIMIGGIGVYYGIKGLKKTPYKIAIIVKSDNDSMGTVLGSGSYHQADTVTIEARSNDGYIFVKWSDDNTDSIRRVVADQDMEFVAYFKAKPKPRPVPKFEITVESSNSEWGVVLGGNGTYDSLAVVTLEAIANDGYQFVSWTDGNKNRIRKVKVLCNQEYKAQFSKKPQSNDPIQPLDGQRVKGKKKYWFGTYDGDLENGIPEGKGVMYYNCHIQIAKYHSSSPGFFAEEGDCFDGWWTNGDISNGRLFDKDSNLKHTIRGKSRTRPYDLEKDEYIK